LLAKFLEKIGAGSNHPACNRGFGSQGLLILQTFGVLWPTGGSGEEPVLRIWVVHDPPPPLWIKEQARPYAPASMIVVSQTNHHLLPIFPLSVSYQTIPPAHVYPQSLAVCCDSDFPLAFEPLKFSQSRTHSSRTSVLFPSHVSTEQLALPELCL
jgi:hypothetical protein